MTGYMAEMRKLVGHKTIMQCAGSIICIDDKGQILLGRRSDNHKWGYAGGAAEIDERVEDCAVRHNITCAAAAAAARAAGRAVRRDRPAGTACE